MNDNWKEVTDPVELFRLNREGWEIEYYNKVIGWWGIWDGKIWSGEWKFRASPPKPKVVTKKLCAWVHGLSGDTIYRFDDIYKDGDWIRQPHLDLEGRFEE